MHHTPRTSALLTSTFLEAEVCGQDHSRPVLPTPTSDPWLLLELLLLLPLLRVVLLLVTLTSTTELLL